MVSKTAFKVEGPYVVSSVKGDGKGRRIADEAPEKFWQKHSLLANKVGCYIYAVKASKGFKPMYVGKATKSFKQEIFTSDKIVKYNKPIFKHCGKPILFFIIYPTKKGGNNKKHISELEDFLIKNGSIKNPELLNKQGINKSEWHIEGVWKHKGGNPGKTAMRFKKMLGIGSK